MKGRRYRVIVSAPVPDRPEGDWHGERHYDRELARLLELNQGCCYRFDRVEQRGRRLRFTLDVTVTRRWSGSRFTGDSAHHAASSVADAVEWELGYLVRPIREHSGPPLDVADMRVRFLGEVEVGP